MVGKTWYVAGFQSGDALANGLQICTTPARDAIRQAWTAVPQKRVKYRAGGVTLENRFRFGKAGTHPIAAFRINSAFPAPTHQRLVAALVRARKVRLKPRCQMCLTEPARSGLRALPTLHFCGKPEVVGGTTFRVVHHVPQPVSGEEIGRKIFCGISTGGRQLRT